MDARTRYKIGHFLDLFKYGNQVADPNTWANRATAISTLTMFISAAAAIADAFGHPLGVASDDINGIALGIVAVGSFIADRIHVAANAEAGHKPNDGAE
jgi:hypothetical protein